MVESNRALPTERRRQILHHLADAGTATVAELSALTGASLATIHRDLDKLSAAGRLVRVHGGATTVEDDPPATTESLRNVSQKRAIAQEAAKFVGPGDLILMEASSTVAMMAEFLPREGVIIVTNDPSIGLDLCQHTGNEIVILGGTLRSQTRAIVGEVTVSSLKDVKVDIAFIGISAISRSGLSSVNPIEAETKRAILLSTDRAIGLATEDKLGRNSLTPVGQLDQLDKLITDALVTDARVRSLMDAGLDVVSVPS